VALHLRILLDTNILIPLQDSPAVLRPNLAHGNVEPADCAELIRKAPLQYDPILAIPDHHHAVVRVQVYSAELHLGLR
jgi:hypothetical protein